MKHIQTRESVRAAKSCYSNKAINRLVPPEGNTPRQVAELIIPNEDRLWGLVHSCGATWEQLCEVCDRAYDRNKEYGCDTFEYAQEFNVVVFDYLRFIAECCDDALATVLETQLQIEDLVEILEAANASE